MHYSNIEKEFQQPVAEVVQIADPIVAGTAMQSQEPEKVDENVELSRIASHIVNNIDPSNEKLNRQLHDAYATAKPAEVSDGDEFVDNNGVDISRNPCISSDDKTRNRQPSLLSSCTCSQL